MNNLYRPVFGLIALLLAIDLLLLILHCAHLIGPWCASPYYSIESDLGLAESFQYLKEGAILLCLLWASHRLGLKGLYAWGALFLYILCDDMFSVHETLGEALADVGQFSPDFLRAKDLGELIISAIAGGFLLSGIAVSYCFGGKAFRAITHDLFLLFGGLVFFGVFVDMLHGGLRMGIYVSRGLGLIEDGGEMLVMSLMLGYAWALLVVPAEGRIHLFDGLMAWGRRRFF